MQRDLDRHVEYPCEPHEFQPDQVQGISWADAIPYINADWIMDGLATAPKRTWEYWLALSSCSSESQFHPGLHKRKCVWEIEGGGACPLLCSYENPSGVFHPALGSMVWKRHRPVRTGPEESCKNDQRVEISFLRRKAERDAELLSLEKRRRQAYLITFFQWLDGTYKKERGGPQPAVIEWKKSFKH